MRLTERGDNLLDPLHHPVAMDSVGPVLVTVNPSSWMHGILWQWYVFM